MSGLDYKTFNANIQEILYKKYNSIVNTGQLIDNEYNVNAAPSILSNKVYLDFIPNEAPDKLTAVNIPNGTCQDGSGVSYLKYYEVKLTSLTGSDTNFVYDVNDSTGTTGAINAADNILTDAIASNYDPKGTYGIKVVFKKPTDPVGTLNGEVFISNYAFDRDAGVLSIYNKPEVTASNPPTIRFWRYEGRKGSSGFGSDWSKYKAMQTVDMSGFAIKGLPDISSGATSTATLLKDVSDNYAVSVAFLKKYVELSGGSGKNVDLTGKVMDISNGAWDASGYRIDNIADISLSKFSDFSDSAVNVNTLLAYLPKGTYRGEYLMMGISGDNKWSVQGTNNVVLGKDVGSTIGTGAVVIGTGAGASGVGNNSILIGANADASGAIPTNTIVLNATGSKLNKEIPARQDNKVVMYVNDLFSATTLNGGTKALYYDPATNSIAAGDICGITMYREDAGDASGWYRYPAEQPVNMQGTPAGTGKNYIFGLKDPSSAPFTYYSAVSGISQELSGVEVYKSMATTVGWVQDYVSKNSMAGDVSDAQSAVTAVNSWVQQFVIDAPPAPTYDTSGSGSQSISLSFKNPSQIYVGAFDMRLPALKKIWVTTDVANNTSILGGNTTYVPDGSEVKKLIFGKPGSSIITGTYSSTDKSYSHQFSENPAGNVTVSVWYTNGNTTHSNAKVNKLVVTLASFSSGSPPSSPTLYTVNDVTGISDTNVDNIKWKAPQQYDSTDPALLTSSQTLNYKITLEPTTTTSRYNGINGSTDEGINTDNMTTISFTLDASVNNGADVAYATMAVNTLFPDTVYNYTIGASNGGAYTTTSSRSFRTNAPAAPPTSFSLTIPSVTNTPYYSRTAKTTLISGVPLVNRTNGANLTKLENVAIHTTSDIGKSSTELTRTLIANIKNSGTTVDNEKSYDVKGFGDANTSNSSAAASSADLTINDIRDYYINDAITKRKGYYKTMDVLPIIKANGIPNTYTPTTNTSSNDVTLTYSLNIYGSDVTANFRVDDLGSTTTPSFSSSDCTTGTGSFTKISGLPYLNNSASLTISSTIANLANRYYRENGVVINLQDSVGSNITGNSLAFTNANEISFVDNTNNSTINKTMMFSYPSNLYSTQLKAKIDAYTVYNNTSNTVITKNYLLDKLNLDKIALLNSEQTISATNTYYLGYPRNITNTENATSGTGILDYVSTTAPTKDAYDHTTLLTGNKALQLVKGRFTTKNGNSDAFLNYTVNDGNSDTNYNYSTIATGMRYMAFSCAVSGITAQSALRIRLNNVSAASISVSDAALTVGGQRAYIYYRYSGGSVGGDSVWIEATRKNNGGTGKLASSLTDVTNSANNISAVSASLIGGSSTGVNDDGAIYSGGNIQYENLIIPTGIVPGKITVLVAVPNEVQFSFDSVSIALGA